MDEFGVLTERFGLKPQGKGAPMAATKRTVNSNNNSRGVAEPYDLGASGDYDDIFGGNVSTTNQSAAPGGGSSFDYDSFFLGSNANSSSFNAYENDDIFGGMPGVKSSNSAKNDSDDIFGSFASPPKQSAPVDDLLGDFVGGVAKPKASSGNNTSNFDDLIPGFGPNVAPNNGLRASKHSARQSTFTSSEDPFIVLESAPTSTSGNAYASSDLFSDPLEGLSKLKKSGGTKPPRVKSPPRATQVSVGSKAKRSDISSIDELEDFARGGVRNNANGRSNSRLSEEWAGTSANRTGSHSEGDLESFFAGPRSVSAPRPRTTTTDSIFDAPTYNREGPRPAVPQKKSSGNSPSIKKSTSASGIYDDLSSMFEEAHIFENFEEVEDESEERKNLRRGRMQRTRERMLKAVSDMNQRDFQSQQEQEEKRRIAETLDVEIKRWAAGKEGNMRALLSSLQFVLWPECGWEPVSLTDVITSASVKKVYRKATLCVHPDKVQQKGATLEQKFTAEKVFDILQEAWKKFNKEELS